MGTLVLTSLAYALPGAIFHLLVNAGPATSARWILFMFVGLVLPMEGARALTGRRSLALAFGLVAFATSILSIASALLHLAALMWLLPLATLFVLWRNRPIFLPTLLRWEMVTPLIFGALAYALEAHLRLGLHAFTPTANSILASDDAYWMGNAAAYFIGFPLPDLRVLGYLTSYHTLYSQFAFSARVLSGLEIYNSVSYLLSGFFLTLFTQALYEILKQRGTRSPWATIGAVGGALITSPISTGSMITLPYVHWVSALTSVGNSVSWILALACFEVVGVGGGFSFWLLPLFFALVGAKISTAMAVITGCGIALLIELVRTRRLVYIPVGLLGIAVAFLAKKIYFDFGLAGHTEAPFKWNWNHSTLELFGSLTQSPLGKPLVTYLATFATTQFSMAMLGLCALLFFARFPFYLLIRRTRHPRFSNVAWWTTIAAALGLAITMDLSGDEKHFLFFALALLNVLYVFTNVEASARLWRKLLVTALTIYALVFAVQMLRTVPETAYSAGGTYSVQPGEAQAYRFIRDASAKQDLIIVKPSESWLPTSAVQHYYASSALSERQSYLEGTGFTFRAQGSPEDQRLSRARAGDIDHLYRCEWPATWQPTCSGSRTAWIVWNPRDHRSPTCFEHQVEKVAEFDGIAVLKTKICPTL